MQPLYHFWRQDHAFFFYILYVLIPSYVYLYIYIYMIYIRFLKSKKDCFYRSELTIWFLNYKTTKVHLTCFNPLPVILNPGCKIEWLRQPLRNIYIQKCPSSNLIGLGWGPGYTVLFKKVSQVILMRSQRWEIMAYTNGLAACSLSSSLESPGRALMLMSKAHSRPIK